MPSTHAFWEPKPVQEVAIATQQRQQQSQVLIDALTNDYQTVNQVAIASRLPFNLVRVRLASLAVHGKCQRMGSDLRTAQYRLI